jgi:small-conductance mechanosensitive channel
MGRYLLIRASTLGIAIVVLLVLSELWRRATLRYVRDVRRRRQFLVVRRVVVVLAISIALVFGFVSEFGSLATYAGLVTAGVAVALQIPILAVVSCFFLIGRYGLRAGDRVTISGVTGEVMEIGIVRIYLMELARRWSRFTVSTANGLSASMQIWSSLATFPWPSPSPKACCASSMRVFSPWCDIPSRYSTPLRWMSAS